MVALLVSAWIEIQTMKQANIYKFVALLVSAWIEITPVISVAVVSKCRTPRECVD